MNSRQALNVASGLAQGLEKATNTMMNIQKAKYEIEQNRELLNLKKKAIEADTSKAAWEQDYKLKELNLLTRKTAVAEKTADITYDTKKAEYEDLNKQNIGFYSQIAQIEKTMPKDTTGNAIWPDGLTVDWKNKQIKMPSTDQAITDAQGNIIGYRPKGSVFQPKAGSTMEFLETENITPAKAPLGSAVSLPEGIFEEDVIHTMSLHKLTRDEVLKRLKR